MFSLFISFDMSISFINQILYWLLFFIIVLYWFNNYFYLTSNISLNIKNIMLKEISISSKMKSNFNLLFFYSMFIMIFLINFLGMWPYSFTLSSQLNFCFFFSMLFWLIIIFNNIINSLNVFVPHLVPLGSPIILSQFMVLIETTSQLIRPVTLGVRLMANMTAGHLIMILCSLSLFLINLISLPLLMLIILEFGVSMIQSYVFIILSMMYMGEFNN